MTDSRPRVAFSPRIDALIREIDALGAHQRLWRYLYRNRRGTPLETIERDLTAMRDDLLGTAESPAADSLRDPR